MSANDCALPTPNPFISFDYNSAVRGLQTPKSLTLVNVEFRNAFALYSNIVEVPSVGALINITHTSFHHISSCGAVVGNVEEEMLHFSASTPYLRDQQEFLHFSISHQLSQEAASLFG